MAGDNEKAGIAAEQLCVVAHRDDRNQTIEKTTRCLRSPATRSIQLGSVLVVGWAFHTNTTQVV